MATATCSNESRRTDSTGRTETAAIRPAERAEATGLQSRQDGPQVRKSVGP